MNKLLSVAVPLYNGEKWIDICLSSFCIPEILDALEVIVVNDGSTDNSSKLAQRYVDTFPQTFKLVNKSNGGHGSVINCAIDLATGTYFKVVDADDWVDKEGLKNLINILSINDADLIINPYIEVDVNTNEKKVVNSVKTSQESIFNKISLLDDVIELIPIALHSMTMRTEYLKSSKYRVSENVYYEDLQYVLYYLMSFNTVYISNDIVYCYLVGQNTQSMNPQQRVKRINHLRVVLMGLLDYYYENYSKFTINLNAIFKDKIIENILSYVGLAMRVEHSNDGFKHFQKLFQYLDNEVFKQNFSSSKKYVLFDLIYESKFSNIIFNGYSKIIRIINK